MHQVRHLNAGDVALLQELNALFGRAFDDPATHGANPPISHI